MKRGQTSRAGVLVRATLAGLALAVWCSPVLAQGGGGGAGAGGGGAGGGGSSSPGGSGGGTGTTAGGSSLFGSSGTGSSGVTSTSGGGTSPINKNNPFSAYYANPLSAGYGANVTLKPANSINVADSAANTKVTGKGLFGVAMISSTTTTTGGKGGAAGGMAGGAGSTSTTNAYASSVGVKRAPSYVTVIGPTMGNIKPPQPMQIAGDLQNTIRDSSFLTTAKGLNVTVTDNQVVVLTGVVATPEEKQLAESLVRMTPNVYFVRNEITVAGPQQIQGPAAVPAVKK